MRTTKCIKQRWRQLKKKKKIRKFRDQKKHIQLKSKRRETDIDRDWAVILGPRITAEINSMRHKLKEDVYHSMHDNVLIRQHHKSIMLQLNTVYAAFVEKYGLE